MISTSLDIHGLDEFDLNSSLLAWKNVTDVNVVKIWVLLSILHESSSVTLSNGVIILLFCLLLLENLTFHWIIVINLNSHL